MQMCIWGNPSKFGKLAKETSKQRFLNAHIRPRVREINPAPAPPSRPRERPPEWGLPVRCPGLMPPAGGSGQLPQPYSRLARVTNKYECTNCQLSLHAFYFFLPDINIFLWNNSALANDQLWFYESKNGYQGRRSWRKLPTTAPTAGAHVASFLQGLRRRALCRAPPPVGHREQMPYGSPPVATCTKGSEHASHTTVAGLPSLLPGNTFSRL